MTQIPTPPTPAAAEQGSPNKPATGPNTGANTGANAESLPLPHERDESTGTAATTPDPVMKQAKRDIDAGLVDTDMRATSGLDATRRAKLVAGSGGTPPAARR